MTMQDEDLARPPFAVLDALVPAQVAVEFVACFDRIAARPDALQYAHGLAMRIIGLDAGEPLHRAGISIARDIDDGIGAGVASGYHNSRHFLEVLLTSLYLTRLGHLDRQRSARVVTAALVHDFHHDGTRSASSPFRLEALAVSMAQPYLLGAGAAPELCEQIAALVLATEPRTGVPFARACLRHDPNAGSMPSAAGFPEPLRRLLVEPDLALEAMVLAEADVLPSIGLTVDHGQLVQDRLAAEWNVTMGPADKLKFVEMIRGEIIIGRFFAPNIEALRQEYARRVRALQPPAPPPHG